MKSTILYFLILAVCAPFQACAQKKSKDVSNFAEILHIAWRPLSEKGKPDSQKHLTFLSETAFSGHDGCNRMKGSFIYSPKTGFNVQSISKTELKCMDNDVFEAGFLYQSASFEVKGSEIIFFDKDKKEVQRLYTIANLKDKNLALPVGDWKMVESNFENFEAVQKAKCEPYLRVQKGKKFVVSYHKNRKEWRSINYFAGYYNLGNSEISLMTDAEASGGGMEGGEDSELAYAFKRVNSWKIEGKYLVFQRDTHIFKFEKLTP